jgi:hypothetical protein
MNTDAQKTRKEERMWAILLSEIKNGSVIPSLEANFFFIKMSKHQTVF